MQQPTVLIVDDIPMFRQAVRFAVERWGAVVIAEAENGREALYRYAEYRPNLVFMDITMPKMNGVESLRWLKRYDEHARVIMCSSVKDSDMISQAIRLGAIDFVPKPFSDQRISEALSLAVEKSSEVHG